MQGYVVRRLLGVIPMVFLVSLVLFFALRLVPGGPLAVYTRGNVDPAAIEVLREKLGLNRPPAEQYLAWLGPATQGDLGFSFRTNRPVMDEIIARIPATFLLMGTTFVLVVIVAVWLGTYSARRQHSRAGIGLTTISFAGAGLPALWLRTPGTAPHPAPGQAVPADRRDLHPWPTVQHPRPHRPHDPAGDLSGPRLGQLVLTLRPLVDARRHPPRLRTDGSGEGPSGDRK